MTRYRHLITDENRKWWTLGAMCFALFMLMLDNTVVNVALPSIERDLGASLSSLEWTVNGYTLAFAVLLATGGRLGDIFGRRLDLPDRGDALLARLGDRRAWRPDTISLVVSRVVQGVGGALMMPATLSIVTNAFPPQAARDGDRHLGRRLGAGAGDRPGAGRLPDGGRLMARDLLHQSPGRRGGRAGDAVRGPGVPRRHGRARGRLPRRRDADRVVDRARPRADRGQLVGLELDRDPRAVRRLRRPDGRVRARGAAGQGADGRVQAVRQPQLRGLERDRADRHLRDDGPVLLPGPLHAEHSRVLAAPGGDPVPAGDLDDRRDRAARRSPHGPDRRPNPDRGRPVAGLGGDGLADDDRHVEPPTATSCPPSS